MHTLSCTHHHTIVHTPSRHHAHTHHDVLQITPRMYDYDTSDLDDLLQLAKRDKTFYSRCRCPLALVPRRGPPHPPCAVRRQHRHLLRGPAGPRSALRSHRREHRQRGHGLNPGAPRPSAASATVAVPLDHCPPPLRQTFWTALADLLEDDGRIDLMAGTVASSPDGHNLLRVRRPAPSGRLWRCPCAFLAAWVSSRPCAEAGEAHLSRRHRSHGARP
jgi:hypothetical protein